MKKNNKLVFMLIGIILTSLLLSATSPPAHLVRLTIINKSGNEIYIRLQSIDQERDTFYYLTIPAGTKTEPTVRAFTIAEEIYYRTTYYGPGKYMQCFGAVNVGELIMDGNVRLNFQPCFSIPTRRIDNIMDFANFDWQSWQESLTQEDLNELQDFDWQSMQNMDWSSMQDMFGNQKDVNIGEPRQEKVIYWDWQKEWKKRQEEALEEMDFGSFLPAGLPESLTDLIMEMMGFTTEVKECHMCWYRYQYYTEKEQDTHVPGPDSQPK
jgi:hypothetical protein